MQFDLFQFARHYRQWWVSICYLDMGDYVISALHVERCYGKWKIDFMGLRCLWFKLFDA